MITASRSRRVICLLWTACALVAALGCTSQQDLRVVVLDGAGRPIGDAVFYAEIHVGNHPVDFVWSLSGREGEVPPTGQAPLRVSWPPGATLALAVMAKGKKPVVVYDALGRVQANGTVFELEDLPPGDFFWEPRMGRLGFPFEDAPGLAERLRAPANERLRAAFLDAYAPIAAGHEVLPSERVKLEALRRLN